MSSESKTISLASGTLSVSLHGGEMRVTVEALETLKKIGELYGLHSWCEDARDRRVVYEDKPVPALVIQEDISYHGSPCWDTVGTLTTDPDRIKQYRAFSELLKYIKQVERMPELEPASHQGDAKLKKDDRGGHER